MDTSSNDYLVAEGPEGLEKALNELLDKSKSDAVFASQEHYILYQLNSQKSIIKVDASHVPFKLWHHDFMGRPATTAVKDTIAKFLWEKCGEKERYLNEFTDGVTGK